MTLGPQNEPQFELVPEPQDPTPAAAENDAPEDAGPAEERGED